MKRAFAAWLAVVVMAGPMGVGALQAQESAPAGNNAAATEAELRQQLEQLERERQAEIARHKRQMEMLAVMQRQAVASHDKAASEQAKQLIEEEKARHAEVLKAIAAKWAQTKAELDRLTK